MNLKRANSNKKTADEVLAKDNVLGYCCLRDSWADALEPVPVTDFFLTSYQALVSFTVF